MSEARPSGRTTPGGFVALTVAALAALAVLIGLGTWQLQRLAWKHALVAAVAERMSGPAVPPPGPAVWGNLAPDDYRYTHVMLTGHYLPGEAHVYALLSDARGPLSGPGYWVVAPFETEQGFVVLVNRGFVPEDRKDPATHAPPPAGTISISGFLREPDPPTWLTPAPEREKNVWFVRDATVLAAAFALPPLPLAPYTFDAGASTTPAEGVPQAGETRTVFPDNHLQYALTWYGLAIGLAGVYAAFAWRWYRGRPGAAADGA